MCVCLCAAIVCFCFWLCHIIPSQINRLAGQFCVLATLIFTTYNIWYTKKKKEQMCAPNAPIQKASVCIVHKRKAPPTAMNPFGLPQDDLCYLTFMFQNGATIELAVPALVYMALPVNQYGVLEYKQPVSYTHLTLPTT